MHASTPKPHKRPSASKRTHTHTPLPHPSARVSFYDNVAAVRVCRPGGVATVRVARGAACQPRVRVVWSGGMRGRGRRPVARGPRAEEHAAARVVVVVGRVVPPPGLEHGGATPTAAYQRHARPLMARRRQRWKLTPAQEMELTAQFVLSTPQQDTFEDNYQCYGCGTLVMNLSKFDYDDRPCCERACFVLWSHVKRARKHWKVLKLLLIHAMPMLRTEMLKRCIQAKYSPDGNGALEAAKSFRHGVKRQRS